MSLADNIRKELKAKKLSVHALEKLAGLRPSIVHNILQGRSKNPTLQTLQAISKALNCSVEELWEDKVDKEQDERMWDFVLYEKAVQLTRQLFQSHNVNIGKQKTLAYVDEIYQYSVAANASDIDIRFAEWLLSKVKKGCSTP